MLLFWVLVAIVVLGAVAVVAAGAGQSAVPVGPERAEPELPADRPVAGRDLDVLRFSVELRGYRMSEVDDVLDRVARDLAWRDARISELEARLGTAPGRVVTEVEQPFAPQPLAPDDLPVSRSLLVPMDGEPAQPHQPVQPVQAVQPDSDGV